MSRLGAVVIGRDEGAKLARCLASVVGKAVPVVYVDSGSADDSIGLARAMGAEVVALDGAVPFTVARARNAGFARLLQLDPRVELVQFVDADSEMIESWFARALDAFAADPRCAIVCGALAERSPERSIYARLYGIAMASELSDPEVPSGIAMARVKALREVGGFAPELVGAEDREMGLRMCRAGWRVLRLDAGMALHETGMATFRQWWRRRVMNGRSICQELALERPPGRHTARGWLSIFFWGVAVPATALAAAWPSGGASLALLLGHVALAARIRRRMRLLGFDRGDARLYALECAAAKFPQGLGMMRYYLERTAARLRRGARMRDPGATSADRGA